MHLPLEEHQTTALLVDDVTWPKVMGTSFRWPVNGRDCGRLADAMIDQDTMALGLDGPWTLGDRLTWHDLGRPWQPL